MRSVIADTGSIKLILLGHIDLLPALSERVTLPSAVQAELAGRRAPSSEGERAAIAPGAALRTDLLLMDDRKGVEAAREKGLRVTGTLGVPELAARDGLVDFAQAVNRLQQANFRGLQDLLNALLAKRWKRQGQD